jgi:hypothetical protein
MEKQMVDRAVSLENKYLIIKVKLHCYFFLAKVGVD